MEEDEYGIFLSKCISAVRNFMLQKGFFEHHLHSTVKYTIDHIDYFPIAPDLYLRVNSEPDIWQIGSVYNDFFWIGSLFRQEARLSEIHQYEFTLLDLYKAGGTQEELVALFIDILHNLERQMDLSALSRLPVRYMTYDDFNRDAAKLEDGWWIVTDYPAWETFYDTPTEHVGYTSKFEIFYVRNGKRTEIGTAGKVGRNVSDRYIIRGEYADINETVTRKEFFGLGFGLERLLVLYLGNQLEDAVTD